MQARVALFASSIGVSIFGSVILPAFQNMFDETGVELPLMTERLLYIQNHYYGPLTLALIVATVAALFERFFPRYASVVYYALSLLVLIVVPLISIIALFLPLIAIQEKF